MPVRPGARGGVFVAVFLVEVAGTSIEALAWILTAMTIVRRKMACWH